MQKTTAVLLAVVMQIQLNHGIGEFIVRHLYRPDMTLYDSLVNFDGDFLMPKLYRRIVCNYWIKE